ncbi:MAG TPA: divergent polysaccharide deacetylase family protein [Thermodesulfobacteriota bacterium]|nr:divergent polysaccharide deacetylase family protein [Deltaproteobacteria bacterium]HNR13022.1 divergent polysaccharide deacetylase family protein [Thermodesulfobacteriota bacterium]HQO77211.1 divergent polysaccharide deacetylase family protein [Thermodesulfobacteriota bacterium]
MPARNFRILKQFPRCEDDKKWLYTEATIIVPSAAPPGETAQRLVSAIDDISSFSSEWAEQGHRSGRLLIRLHGLPTHSCTIVSRPFSLAIIIDDIGEDIALTRQFLNSGVPLTLAILPDLSYSQESERLAYEAGYEVMLHLPMEPVNLACSNPGPMAIYHDMNKAEVQGIIEHHLKAFTHVNGVNNHMGSRVTRDEEILTWVIEAIRPKGLYFVDSRTSSQSVAYAVAHAMGVPAGRNTVFLDNDHDVASCKTYIEKAISTVKKQGSAIAIGHSRRTTLQAIQEMESRFHEEEIALVFASEVVQ